MRKINRSAIHSWIVVIIWMALIFVLSSQEATESDELSTGIVGIVINWVQSLTGDFSVDLELFNHIVRKLAHFTIYFILGILVTNSVVRSGFSRVVFRLSFAICVIYAISDELHQVFVPGRSGEIRDVIIDSLGSLVGIMAYKLVNKERMKKFVKR